jgi:hypothetical protein
MHRPERILWAHSGASRIFDHAVGRLALSFPSAEVEEVHSRDAAVAALARTNDRPTLALVALDLPNSPDAAAFVTRRAEDVGVTSVLLGRGRRWVPPSLHHLPFLGIEAAALPLAELRRVVLRSRTPDQPLGRSSHPATHSIRRTHPHEQGSADPV